MRPVRRAARLALALLVAAVVAVPAVAAGDPRREQERLAPADMALAKRVALRAGDLGTGWMQAPLPAEDGGATRCPGFNPDFSRFTITGKARSGFTKPTGSSILSVVEVYASAGQAVGDFRLGTGRGVTRCLATTLERAAAQVGGGVVTFRVRSSRMSALRGIGDRGAVFRVVASLSVAGRTLPMYLDVLVFQRGRTITALMFTSVLDRVPGQLALARTVAARMR